MKKLRIMLVAVLALTVALAFTSCGGGGSDEEVSLRCGTHYNTDHANYKVLEEMVQEISDATDGKVTIELFPSSQLGDYTNMYEQLKNGDLDMSLMSIPSEYDPRIEMNFVPYLVANFEEFKNVMGPDTYFMEEYTKVHADQNVKLLGVYAEGLIGIGMTKKPNNYGDPNVKKGLKVRAPAIEVYSDVTKALGYNATTINYSDLYTALQTGVVDGWIGGTPQLNYTDFKDVIKYYIPYNVFAENGGIFMSQSVFDGLPEDYQKAIQEAANNAVLKSIENAEKNDNEAMDKLKEYGVEILPLTDDEIANCKKVVIEKVWPSMEKKIGADVMEKLKSN